MPSPSVQVVRIRLLSGLVAAALALVACGGDSGSSDGATAAGGDVGAVTEAELLSFEGETIGGETVDIADYAGSDLVIWFWAPW